MKKVIVLVVIMLMIGVMPVFAGVRDHGHGDTKPIDEIVFGAKADAPNLLRLSENWTIGAEASKDLRRTASDEGWEVFGKLTYTGSIFDLSN